MTDQVDYVMHVVHSHQYFLMLVPKYTQKEKEYEEQHNKRKKEKQTYC